MISSPRRGKQLADKVYQDIKDDIFAFRLLPGDRFSEHEMAQRTGASRTPVREALFRLEREGYVEVSPRNGWQVKPFDFHYFEELYDVRTVLECAAVRRLCELENLADTLQPLMSLWGVPEDQRLRDISGVLNLDENFHSELVRTAGNGEMTRIHQNITERLRIIRRLDFTKRARIDATYDEHHAILETILHRRVEPAQIMLKAHIEASRNEVRKITLHMLYEARRQGSGDNGDALPAPASGSRAGA